MDSKTTLVNNPCYVYHSKAQKKLIAFLEVPSLENKSILSPSTTNE